MRVAHRRAIQFSQTQGGCCCSIVQGEQIIWILSSKFGRKNFPLQKWTFLQQSMKTINQVEWTFLGKIYWTKDGWRLQLDLATNPLFDCDEIPEARLCWGDINSKAQDNYKKNNYMDQDNYNLDKFRHDRSCQERDSAEERVVSGMWRFPWLLDILISFQFMSCHIGFVFYISIFPFSWASLSWLNSQAIWLDNL